MRFRTFEHKKAMVVYQLTSSVQMEEDGDVFSGFVVDELVR